jgi:hypothetical protein
LTEQFLFVNAYALLKKVPVKFFFHDFARCGAYGSAVCRLFKMTKGYFL